MSDECKKAFEEWCKKNDLPWKRDYTDFFYTYHKTEVAWNTWQAAWSARGDGWASGSIPARGQVKQRVKDWLNAHPKHQTGEIAAFIADLFGELYPVRFVKGDK